MTNKELDNNLRQFYAEARTKDGELYSRSSLLGFRNAIERYLNNPPLNRGISITKGVEFQASNKLLQSQIKLNKRKNKENTKHKPAIPEADLQKLNLHCNSGRQSLGPSAECLVSHQLELVSPRTRRSTRTHKTKLRVLGGREQT